MVNFTKLFKIPKKRKVKIIKKVIIIKEDKRKSPGQVLRDRIARRKKRGR